MGTTAHPGPGTFTAPKVAAKEARPEVTAKDPACQESSAHLSGYSVRLASFSTYVQANAERSSMKRTEIEFLINHRFFFKKFYDQFFCNLLCGRQKINIVIWKLNDEVYYLKRILEF